MNNSIGLGFTWDLVIILVIGFIGGLVSRKARQPPLVGFILGGFLFGNLLGGLLRMWPEVTGLAEIGVALLMFTLGIELSLRKFIRSGKIIFWAALIQIILTILVGLIFLPRFGFDFYQSLFLGSCFSLSSTAVVVKLLEEKGELSTLPGETMVTFLLIQDLTVLPMLIILPQVGHFEGDFARLLNELFLGLLKGGALLVLVGVFGRKYLPVLVDKLATLSSRELLTLGVLAFCLLAAFGTQALGLSFVFGAFLAGLLISETVENHAIFAEIRPLRDIFSIIFFVSLGFLLPFSFLVANLSLILILTIFFSFIKFLIIFFLLLYLKYHTKSSFIIASGLFQVGEFAFVLGTLGKSGGLIDENTYSLILFVTLLTMVITPFVMVSANKVYFFIKDWLERHFPPIYGTLFTKLDRRLVVEELPISGHVVLCGFGRVGSYVGRALEMAEIPMVVIDYNRLKVAFLEKKGINVIFGDPAELPVLKVAKIEQASFLILAIPDRFTQEMVILNAQTLNSKIQIICRTHLEQDQKRLKDLGVGNVIQPEFEAALSMVKKILASLGRSEEEISGKISRLKIEHGLG